MCFLSLILYASVYCEPLFMPIMVLMVCHVTSVNEYYDDNGDDLTEKLDSLYTKF